MTRRGWVLSGLAAILAASWLIWPAGVAAQTIKVGSVVPLTGRYAAGGAQVRAGYEIAVDDVNRAGGVTVGGKKMPLELVILDDESDATKTVARLESLSTQGVVAYLGGFGSDLHHPAAILGDVSARHKRVLSAPPSSSPCPGFQRGSEFLACRPRRVWRRSPCQTWRGRACARPPADNSTPILLRMIDAVLVPREAHHRRRRSPDDSRRCGESARHFPA